MAEREILEAAQLGAVAQAVDAATASFHREVLLSGLVVGRHYHFVFVVERLLAVVDVPAAAVDRPTILGHGGTAVTAPSRGAYHCRPTIRRSEFRGGPVHPGPIDRTKTRNARARARFRSFAPRTNIDDGPADGRLD